VAQSSMQSFLEACGCPEPLSLTVTGPEPASSHKVILNQPFAIVGEARSADISLRNRDVSRRHVYLQMIDGRPFLIDLHSRIGTYWGGARRLFGWLDSPYQFHVGPYRIGLDGLEVSPGSQETFNPLEAGSHDPNLALSLVFEIGRRSGKPVHWRMNRRMALVGDWSGCKIRLHGKRVSRCHCCLVCTARGLWVVDLLSRDGVFLNGEKIKIGQVNENDKLQVGEFVLSPHFGGAFWIDLASREIKDIPQEQPLPGQALVVAPAGPRDLAPLPSALPAVLGEQIKNLTARSARTVLDVDSPIPSGNNTLETILGPLLNQFSSMQQQMFDQFHHTVMGLFQMFGTLYRDQFELIRDELDKVQELTRELQELQAELGKYPAAAPAPAAADADARPARETTQPEKIREPDAPRSEPRPQPPRPTAKETATVAASAERKAPPQPPSPPTGQPAPPPGVDIHAWLHQRMAAIQEERQSRWQKILSFLGGKKG
jgi:hypothetical protein